MDGMDLCRLYVSGKKSNYEKLFGTPERAAQTVFDAYKCSMEAPIKCDDCAAAPICDLGARNYNALLEWLRGDE